MAGVWDALSFMANTWGVLNNGRARNARYQGIASSRWRPEAISSERLFGSFHEFRREGLGKIDLLAFDV
ncbi:hypothetical protein J8J22_23945, partial [Mycobacterium tuberculosis]|nr:hypothetical protein [Mycobacterium tuberculosis]